METLTFDIKRYAINDGPGIRTTIFLKGCPLSCVWCHNPEGISPYKQRMYSQRKCIGCGACVKACSHQVLSLAEGGVACYTENCVVCGVCAEVCPSKATEISGEKLSVKQLMKEVEKEIPFMDQSGGGITICGGEPLMHPTFLSELLLQCGERGIHRVVDTSLYASSKVLMSILPHVDLFLVDLKMMDSEKHRLYCGVSNEPILSNIRLLAESNVPFTIRMPLIKGVNAELSEIDEAARFLKSLPWDNKEVNILPYHDIGKGKHQRLKTVYNPNDLNMSTPSDDTLEQCIAIFCSYGINAVVGG